MAISSAPDSLARWTSQEIQERLGISTGAVKTFGGPIGAREIAAIREAGITRIEIDGLPGSDTPMPAFDFHNSSQVSEILAECQKQSVSIVSVHVAGGPSTTRETKRRGRQRQSKPACMHGWRRSWVLLFWWDTLLESPSSVRKL